MSESDNNIADTSAAPKSSPFTLLRKRTFLALWLTGAITAIVRWLEVLAIGVFAFDLTGSPIIVSILLLARMLPMSIVGFWVALMAERVGPRLFLKTILAAMVIVSLVLAWLVYTNQIEVWHLVVGVFLSGCLQASDMPVRRIMLGEVAGLERVGAAMALDSSTNNITRLLGPMLGGILLVSIGLHGAFALSAALYVLSFLLLSTVSVGQPSNISPGIPVLRNLVEGIRLVRENRLLVGFLLITVVYNICGFPFLSMVPVVGKDVLGLGPVQVGLLAGAEGAGAFIGSMTLAVFARPRWFLTIYSYGTVLAIAMILLFGLSGTIGLSATIIPIVGLGSAGFSSMQSAIVFSSAPPHLRGRLMGVVAVCIGLSPLGYLQLGYLADWYGASAAISIVAVEGLIALALILWRWPELRRRMDLSVGSAA